MRVPASQQGRPAAGFTLAEVAVTIAIVAISLTLSMKVLNGATMTAAHTRNQKTARELGLYTLGQVDSGLYWEELDNGYRGSYADLDYPDYFFEVVLGDEAFDDQDPYDPDAPFDNLAYQRELEYDDEDYDDEAAQPYEKIKVRVTFPPMRDFDNQVDLERWIPWAQVYGPDETEAAEGDEGGDGPPGAEAGN